jgi:ribonucleoside-diphosphate reductase beta chain
MGKSLLSHPPMVYKMDHGFDYPQFFDYYQKALSSVWRPQEVSLSADVRDWQHNTTQAERDLVIGILRGFTSTELGIGCYWGDKVCKMTPKPEVHAMARMFSAFEQIHAEAYNYLSDTLGINEFEEFLSDPIAQQKVENFFRDCSSDKVSLAVFSGAGEGVSLYSSFAILLAFSKDGRFKGLAQIISWSSIDESVHSDGGCELFRELVAETGITDQEVAEIYRGFNVVIENEYAFLENIFSKVDNTVIPIALPELKAYIKSRANNRLARLGLTPTIPITGDEITLADRISSWFDPMVAGQMSTDFFARQKAGDSYVAKPSQDFSTVNLSTLSLELI